MQNIAQKKYIFPDEFQLKIYKQNTRESVDELNEVDLYQRWREKEQHLGLQVNAIKNRFEFINLINKNDKILEIGPFVNPIIMGEGIKYADVLNREKLIERAVRGGRKFNFVPEIDYVIPDMDLKIIEEKFDSIVSSHCIEHQPNLIAHLQDIERILNDGGSYFLIIPDKRYCFDRYLPCTTIADVVEAFYEKRKTHSLKNIIMHRALTTHNNPSIHWENSINAKKCVESNNTSMPNAIKIKSAIDEWEGNVNEYIDVHSMFFSPEIFREIIQLLGELKFTNLYVDKIYHTNYGAIEFFAILSKKIKIK